MAPASPFPILTFSLSHSLATAADLRHYAIPELQNRLTKLEDEKKAEERQLRAEGGEALAGDTVTPEAIQAVVSQWSGIPVSNMKVRRSPVSTLLSPTTFHAPAPTSASSSTILTKNPAHTGQREAEAAQDGEDA